MKPDFDSSHVPEELSQESPCSSSPQFANSLIATELPELIQEQTAAAAGRWPPTQGQTG